MPSRFEPGRFERAGQPEIWRTPSGRVTGGSQRIIEDYDPDTDKRFRLFFLLRVFKRGLLGTRSSGARQISSETERLRDQVNETGDGAHIFRGTSRAPALL
jgi:hypothetical protein